MNKFFSRALVALSLFGVPAMVLAPQAAMADAKKPRSPAVTVDATFDRFVIGPAGKIAGLLLKDGSVVRVHDKGVSDTSLRAGDALKVEGHKRDFTTGTVYGHAIVKKNGVVVADGTKKHEKGEHKKATLADVTTTSTVSGFLIGHKGHIAGLVLADGSFAHAGHGKSFDEFGLKKGDAVTVTGKGGSYALGRAQHTLTIKLPSGVIKTL